MATKLNLHKLMGPSEGYLNALRVPEQDEQKLRQARETIRDRLRYAFQHWSEFVRQVELYDAVVKTAMVESAAPRLPTPKFRLQGSFAYHTVNDCQDPPTQQIDQDDGLFLPISFVSVNGRTRPTIASAAYFKIVERALAPLCEERGWKLNPGKVKNSCVRVEIDWRLHIDIPLYAIRDGAFERLVEYAASTSLAKSVTAIRDSRELDEQIYRDLADAELILAHRRDGWIESDPRRLEKWFASAIDLYGEPVRWLSRCYKGLRDAKFDDGLSSICIMACVVRAIENLGGVDPKRLDLALVQVGREIARIAVDPVENPVFPGDATKHFCLGWDAAYREKVRRLFRDAADQLEEAIDAGYHHGLALQRARRAYGDRVPSDERLIVTVTPAEVVRGTPAQPQPAAVVPRTKSG